MNKLVNGIAWLILTYSIAMSTTHIVETSLKIGLAGVAAYTSPVLVDAVFALGKLGRSRRYSDSDKIRKSSLGLMLFGGAMSLTCNVVAGANWGQRIHGIVVVVVMVWIESHAAKLVGHVQPATATTVAPIASPVVVATPAPVALAPAIVTAPTAPLMPARPRVATPARSTRPTITATVAAPTAVNPRTGQPYSVRHARRIRTGK